MASMTANNDSLPDLGLVSGPTSQYVFYLLATVLFFAAVYHLQHDTSTKFDLINPRGRFEFTTSRVKKDFLDDAEDLIADRFRKQPGKPFRVYADHGEMTIFPPEFAEVFRSDPRLSFDKPIAKSMHSDYPGFDGISLGAHSEILHSVLKTRLTSALAHVTEPLSDECTSAVHDIFKEDSEWHEISLKNLVLQLVARLSSKVFLGDELCRDEAWLKITIAYTVNLFLAAEKLRLWPSAIRPLAHWFVPECRLLRAQVAEAKALIGDVLKRRRAEKAAARAEGRPEPEHNDAIEWFEKESKGRPYNAVNAQLGLSLAAIHTTTDLLTQSILDIAQHPEAVGPLREEIIEVISEGGWKKATLSKLKLLDSTIKESQRTKPMSIVSMRREALAPVTLKDGTVLPKGTTVTVSSSRMWDPTLHESPEEWRSDRFLRLRETPGMEHRAHLVSTSGDHLGFGHGQHACPGRFFAANEVKIALSHLLLKYDFAPVEGSPPKVRKSGFSMNVDPFAKVQVRRRREEIDI